MADFDSALTYTLANEGGFVDNAADSGGATNFGITQATLSAYYGRAASVSEVQALDPATVREIYLKYYWLPLNLDLFGEQGKATAIFDCAVNFGTYKAAQFAQTAANDLGAELTPDGAFGPLSLSVIDALPTDTFIQSFHDIVKVHYDTIVAVYPKDAVFYAGWMRRANRLLSLA